mgnify:CR=1 FL=1
MFFIKTRTLKTVFFFSATYGPWQSPKLHHLNFSVWCFVCPSVFHNDFSDWSREHFFFWKGFLLHRKLKIRISFKERFYFWTEDMTSIFLFDLKFVKKYFGGRRGIWCSVQGQKYIYIVFLWWMPFFSFFDVFCVFMNNNDCFVCFMSWRDHRHGEIFNIVSSTQTTFRALMMEELQNRLRNNGVFLG